MAIVWVVLAFLIGYFAAHEKAAVFGAGSCYLVCFPRSLVRYC